MLEDQQHVEPMLESLDQTLLAISTATWIWSNSSTTLRIQGSIQHIELVILIDSGSTHTYISKCWRTTLSGMKQLDRQMSIKVANGQVLTSA
jgi:hypothetical protein